MRRPIAALATPGTSHQHRTGGLRIENIGEIKSSIVAPNVAAAHNYRETAVGAVGSEEHSWMPRLPNPVSGFDANQSSVLGSRHCTHIAGQNISPTRTRRRRRGCRRTIILRSSENSVRIRGMLGEADELGHRTQVLIEIVE